MRKKHGFGIICVAIISVVIIFGNQINPEYIDSDQLIDISDVFHVRLADPELYENGVYHKSFVLENGVYEFRFTPNGDSPRSLSITLIGDSILFYDQFPLLFLVLNHSSSTKMHEGCLLLNLFSQLILK